MLQLCKSPHLSSCNHWDAVLRVSAVLSLFVVEQLIERYDNLESKKTIFLVPAERTPTLVVGCLGGQQGLGGAQRDFPLAALRPPPPPPATSPGPWGQISLFRGGFRWQRGICLAYVHHVSDTLTRTRIS